MRIGLAQIEVTTNKLANLNKIAQYVEKAKQQGVELIVFPEASMYSFGAQNEMLNTQAEPLAGPFVSALGLMAAQHDMWIMAGMFESAVMGSRVLNTLVLLDSEGKLVDKYRKIHLYDALGMRESSRMQHGDGGVLLFQCRGLVVGAMTCYDVRFPELSRHLAVKGADLLLMPSAWYAGPFKDMHLEVLSRARAIENNVYVAVAVQVGEQFTGNSMVIDPMGVVQQSLSEGEGLLICDVNRERVRAVRSKMPTLSNRREEVYAAWLAKN